MCYKVNSRAHGRRGRYTSVVYERTAREKVDGTHSGCCTSLKTTIHSSVVGRTFSIAQRQVSNVMQTLIRGTTQTTLV